MASKRKSIPNSNPTFNFRPQTESQKWETKGLKPLPEPVSVLEALIMMAIHISRRIIFLNSLIKVCIYLASLFLISFLADVMPFPKTYFSRSDNFLNQYFVKIGWGWTLLATIPFNLLTSYTLCCGRRDLIIKHISRLVIATFFWYFCTNSFGIFSNFTGKCSVSKGKLYITEEACRKAGYLWHSLNISGHAFILIYSSLVIIEESRSIIGWETIKDHIRNEEHSRIIKEQGTSNPLKNLSHEEFFILKKHYELFTPYIRGLFLWMTSLVLLWDFMLLCTELYFHIMVEKLLAGIIAITVWFLTYNVWYKVYGIPPDSPGEGLFKYNKPKEIKLPLRSRGSMNTTRPGELPKFLGMPLTGLRQPLPPQEPKDPVADELDQSPIDNDILIRTRTQININTISRISTPNARNGPPPSTRNQSRLIS